MMPRIRNRAPPRTDEEQLIMNFFALPEAKQDQIIAWYNGTNLITLKPLLVGDNRWTKIGIVNGWMRYYDLFKRCVPERANNIYRAVIAREQAAADEVAAHEQVVGAEFNDYRRRILAGEVVYTYFGRTYEPLPVVPRDQYNYRREHACITCGAIFTHGTGNLFYAIEATCDCPPADNIYEFDWDFIDP